MIKCIAIDDEPPALELMCSYINRTPFLNLLKASNSALDLMEDDLLREAELLFIDIEMPDISGLSFIKSLKNPPKIIFTTAYDQYAVESYKVEALDYLLKPISYEEFLSSAHKAKEFLHMSQSSEKNSEAEFIFVRSEYKLVKLRFEDILFIEGLKDYVKFHLSSTKKPVHSLINLKKLEEKLPASLFMRTHRSYIVNLKKIESVERRIIHFETGKARLSENNREDFLERINSLHV
ncbi:two component transcriptional regulator, LytTR family [Gracilimonas mengyeensis]|uniref:Two component transcriptional regulator, LytTR family n=2 Tax=Gracilimonas mengyeensis TaxID=1302730 RepID=A0A521BUZ7_9BACT|nr:two component transcriptional regulator, LytTR family [Gracilimonas mengyeensis]